MIPQVIKDPYGIDNSNIKKLTKYQHMYRYKIGIYRLVYRILKRNQQIELLMIDQRSTVYKRLSNRITSRCTDLVEGSGLFPSTRDVSEPTASRNDRSAYDVVESVPQEVRSSRNLPNRISREFLRRCGIEDENHNCFLGVSTEDEILSLSCATQEEILRVIDGIYPASLKSLEEQPKRTFTRFSELLDASTGKRELASFLLALDEEQDEFLNRLSSTGPWLLKGGPGTGKSVCAIYAVKRLEEHLVKQLAFDEGPVKVLFTTYTKSLVNVSNQLFDMLKLNQDNVNLHVLNYNSLANRYLTEKQRSYKVTADPKDLIQRAIRECSGSVPSTGFSVDDYGFLQEEIISVILGRPCLNIDDYRQEDRKGRGRGLNFKQRHFVWKTYETLRNILHHERRCLFAQQVKGALENARHQIPEYDFVFIDEAQDFSPAALRLCTAVVKTKKNVFLTADVNQTIYGASMSWKRLTEGLNFRGRTKIFRRNYRSTRQIINAAEELTRNIAVDDVDCLKSRAVYDGAKPAILYYQSLDDAVDRIMQWIKPVLRQERIGLECSAILCATNAYCKDLEYGLRQRGLDFKFFKPNELDIKNSSGKIVTLHASKGLEFPIVIVAGLEEGRLPFPPKGGLDEYEHINKWGRAFLVGCTRAMKRLMILVHSRKPSEFVSSISGDAWDIDTSPEYALDPADRLRDEIIPF